MAKDKSEAVQLQGLQGLKDALSLHPSGFNISLDDGRLLYANHAYEELWGFAPGQASNMPTHEERAEFILPKLVGDTEQIRTKLRYILDHSVDYRTDMFQMHMGKSLERIVLRLPPPNECAYLVEWRVLSLTEQQTKQVEYERDLLLELTEHIPDQIFFKDLESRFVRINSSLAKRYGVEDWRSVIGKTDSDFYGPEHGELTRNEELQIMQSREPQVKRLHHEVWEDGSETWNISTKFPWTDSDGSVIGIYGIALDVTEIKQKEQEIWRQANIDPLTQLANKNLLHSRWQDAFENARQKGCSVGLIHLDIDHFANTNNALGHNLGDLILQAIAYRLESIVKPYGSVARLAGDEFGILVEEINDPIALLRIASRIQLSFDDPFIVNQESVHLSATLGLALTPEHASDFESLLTCAEQANLMAKRPEVGNIQQYNTGLTDDSIARFTLGNQLKDAVRLGQLEVELQPIINCETGSTEKVEALVRWNHSDLGYISPAQFIPIAETTGSIIELGDFVFREAIRMLIAVERSTGQKLSVSINMSPVQLYSSRFDIGEWQEYLTSVSFNPQQISVEITEGIFLDPNPRVMQRLRALSQLGFSLSMDDFGTGYSSLTFMDTVDFNYLKLDRSFVKELDCSLKKRTLAKAVLDMAKALEIQVIAEGVETAEQVKWLKQMGCKYLQGFYFSKSLNLEALCARLQDEQQLLIDS